MPSNNIELEAKALLNKKEYEKLLKSLPFDEKVKNQQNYFLETDDRLLSKYQMMIRLRKREDKYKLTLKAPLGEGLLDKSQVISDEEANSLITNSIFPRGDVQSFLEMLHIDPDTLHIVAELETERRECQYHGCEIDISKNTYSGKVDYELECDSDSALTSQNTIKEICDQFQVEYKPNNLSKELRALGAVDKKKK